MLAAQLDEEAIFNAARKIDDPAALEAYLRDACPDAALRERVEALLAIHDQERSFLNPAGGAHSPTVAERPITESPGTVIGPYKLLEQIGEGGFGVVFMAEQTQPVKRRVALKVIKPGMDTRQVIARFEAERQALALMDHPHIAKVLDAGATQTGRPFFVMELVKGVPITDYCDQHLLTPKQRLELFVTVCQAVQHAHQKGIIHRDIKPSNVLVTLHDDKPVVKVIDFGIAKATSGQLTDKTLFTGFAQLVGTPLYMSPEQASMTGLDVDTRSDIYSLGVLLYELLTGTTPLDKTRLQQAAFDEVRRIIREEEPQKPSTRLSSSESLPSVAANRHLEPAKLTRLVRGDLDWIVMKALEKDRTRRYETANGFAADVLHYLADEPVTACPPSVGYRFQKFARRNTRALAAGVLLATTLVAAVVVLAISNVLIRNERNAKDRALADKMQALEEKDVALNEKQAALTQAQTNFEEAKRQEAIARDLQRIATDQTALANRRLYASQMNLAMQAWQKGESARTLQLLESQRPRFDEDDLRGFDWYYLWRLCQGTHRFSVPTLGHDNASAIAISPDGATLASVYGGAVRLWDLSTGRQIGELPGGDTLIGGLAFSPDSKTLATSDDSDTVKLWNLTTKAPRATVQAGQRVDRAHFTEEGRTLVLSGEHIKLWNLATNQAFATLGADGKKVNYAASSPDGGVIAGTGDDIVRVWIREGKEWREAPPVTGGGWYEPVVISPDGKLLAVGAKLYQLPTCQLRRPLEGHAGPVYAVAFTRDGRRLATGGQDRTVRTWDVETGRGETCLAQPGPVYGLAITPDGATVAAKGSDTIHVWDAAIPPSASMLPHETHVDTVAFSPDGKVLACQGRHETKLWDVSQERTLATLPTQTEEDWFRGLAFSPDGQSLAVTTGQAINVWSVQGQRLAELACQAIASQVAYLPDGKSIAAMTRSGAVEVWDLLSKQRRYATPPGSIGDSVAVSPDGRLLAAGYQLGIVKLFDADTGRELKTLQRFELAIDWVFCLAFSPDSRKLASGDGVGVVRIWDVATSRLDATLVGHTDAIWSLAFLDAGRTLASGSEDRTVRLWEVETGQERIALTGHESRVNGLDYSENERVLASACDDGNVRLWRGAVDERARAPRLELDSGEASSPVGENEFGDRSWQAGRTEEAEAAYRRALIRLEQLHAARPDTISYRRELIRSLLSISLLLRLERSDAAAAETLRKRAMEIYELLTPQEQQALFFIFGERQRKLRASGDMAQADRTWSQMIEFRPQENESKPGVPETKQTEKTVVP